METIDEVKNQYKDYSPKMTEEELILFLEDFVTGIIDYIKDYKREKRKYRIKERLKITENEIDAEYFRENEKILDQAISLSERVKEFIIRTKLIANNDNCFRLYKLMKFVQEFYYKWTDNLCNRLNVLDSRYDGIQVTCRVIDTKGFESFVEEEITSEEEKTVPAVSESDLITLDKEYDQYVVPEELIKSTSEIALLWLSLDTQIKELERVARRFERKGNICEKIAGFLNDSKVLSNRAAGFFEMQKLTESHRDLLLFIRSVSKENNLDEMRKLADFSSLYYQDNMKLANNLLNESETTSGTYYSERHKKRIAVIRTFVKDKVNQISISNKVKKYN